MIDPILDEIDQLMRITSEQADEQIHELLVGAKTTLLQEVDSESQQVGTEIVDRVVFQVNSVKQRMTEGRRFPYREAPTSV